jgi:hypothetical protein
MKTDIINKKSYQIYTPVLFMAFNRFEVTQKVFLAIREAKPLKLYFALDGPRKSHIGEKKKINEIKDFVLKNVDWKCEVKTLFREENLGCKGAISGAINWVFENEEQAIILEDDCVPSVSFFLFCQELLEKYKNDERVMHINGTYYLKDIMNNNSSYYFSKLNGVWGWATWRRAWYYYDASMQGYLESKENGVITKYFDNKDIEYWMTKYFDDVYHNQQGSNWDPIWSYAILMKGALCISPTSNLVKNIGFSAENATHGSSDSFLMYEEFESEEINSIVHPDTMLYNGKIDSLHMQYVIKKTDPFFLVKDFKHYFKKLFFPGRYLIYLSKILSSLKDKLK